MKELTLKLVCNNCAATKYGEDCIDCIGQGCNCPCQKNPAAVALGRLGGLASKGKTSEAKKKASRENGKKGGWPKGKPRKVKET